MTVKKVAIIAAAGAVLLAGALTLSMTLITRNKIEVTATETSAQNETEQEEGGVKTLENMENMPLYFEDTEKLLLPLRNTMEALGGKSIRAYLQNKAERAEFAKIHSLFYFFERRKKKV